MQCKARSKQSGQRCKNQAVPTYEVCYMHGGKTPRGEASPNWKHGNNSKERLKRDAILASIANHRASDDDLDALDNAIKNVADCIRAGNFEASKYLIDQLAGTPKTTVRNEVTNPEAFVAFGQALANAGLLPETVGAILLDVEQILGGHDTDRVSGEGR